MGRYPDVRGCERLQKEPEPPFSHLLKPSLFHCTHTTRPAWGPLWRQRSNADLYLNLWFGDLPLKRVSGFKLSSSGKQVRLYFGLKDKMRVICYLVLVFKESQLKILRRERCGMKTTQPWTCRAFFLIIITTAFQPLNNLYNVNASSFHGDLSPHPAR